MNNRFKIPTKTKKEGNDDVLEILKKMVKEYPNNMELGKEIRKFINNLEK